MTAPPSPRPHNRSLSLSEGPRSDSDDDDIDMLARRSAPPVPARLHPSPPRCRRSTRAAALPPANVGGMDLREARDLLETAVSLDIHGKYNQALTAYNEAHTKYAPGLNSLTISPSSRRALERTLAPHHERTQALEDAQVFDEAEPDRIMVDHSRVRPLIIHTDGDEFTQFRLPGTPASLLYPSPIGERPNPYTEDGVDQYLQELSKMFNRGNRFPEPARTSPVERAGTPMPGIERQDSSPPRGRTPKREGRRDTAVGPSGNEESSRERARTPLPGGAENFESRHPKRGLSSYGSVDRRHPRKRRHKSPKILGHENNSAGKALDRKMAERLHKEANKSEWMQDLYWNHRSQLHGQLAKDKWAELRGIRGQLPHMYTYLIDQGGASDDDEVMGERHDTPFDVKGPKVRLCGQCGRTRRPDGGRLRVCERCRQTRYCSAKCQQEHAASHFPVCFAHGQRPNEQQLQRVQAASSRLQALAAMQNRTPETDIHQMAQDANRQESAVPPGIARLRQALMAGTIDIDEYQDEACKIGDEFIKSQAGDLPDPTSDSSSSSGSSSDSDGESHRAFSPQSPRSPRTPAGRSEKKAGGGQGSNVAKLHSDLQKALELQQGLKDDDPRKPQMATVVANLLSKLSEGSASSPQPPPSPRTLGGQSNSRVGADNPSLQQHMANTGEEVTSLLLKLKNGESPPPGTSHSLTWEQPVAMRGPKNNDNDSKGFDDNAGEGSSRGWMGQPMFDNDASALVGADLMRTSNEWDWKDRSEVAASPKKAQTQEEMQIEMWPKRVTDFRIQADGGRVLEYQVSDAKRDQEWCRAPALEGDAW